MLNTKQIKIADAEPGMLIESIMCGQLYMIVAIENHWYCGHRLVMFFQNKIISSPCSLDDDIFVVF